MIFPNIDKWTFYPKDKRLYFSHFLVDFSKHLAFRTSKNPQQPIEIISRGIYYDFVIINCVLNVTNFNILQNGKNYPILVIFFHFLELFYIFWHQKTLRYPLILLLYANRQHSMLKTVIERCFLKDLQNDPFLRFPTKSKKITFWSFFDGFSKFLRLKTSADSEESLETIFENVKCHLGIEYCVWKVPTIDFLLNSKNHKTQFFSRVHTFWDVSYPISNAL